MNGHPTMAAPCLRAATSVSNVRRPRICPPALASAMMKIWGCLLFVLAETINNFKQLPSWVGQTRHLYAFLLCPPCSRADFETLLYPVGDDDDVFLFVLAETKDSPRPYTLGVLSEEGAPVKKRVLGVRRRHCRQTQQRPSGHWLRQRVCNTLRTKKTANA